MTEASPLWADLGCQDNADAGPLEPLMRAITDSQTSKDATREAISALCDSLAADHASQAATRAELVQLVRLLIRVI